MQLPLIREVTLADHEGILAIYNDVIATSTAVYSFSPETLEDRRAWLESRRVGGYPVFVARHCGEVVGFSSFGEFRGAWPGYRYSVEHSVHVRSDSRGHGLGSRLVEALFGPAAAMGKHVMIGGIDAANHGSLRMHERLGFQRVAHFREVGHKFGRWLDLVFVQRFMDGPGTARSP
jgi:L-amino acid N-acyltransferase YncA